MEKNYSFSCARESTGDHPVHFALLSFCVEMTVQELVVLYFNLGLHYKDIVAFLASRHRYILSQRHLKKNFEVLWSVSAQGIH